MFCRSSASRGKSFSISVNFDSQGLANQTWMFAGEQCDNALSSAVWKATISSRETDVGSGRNRPAENEAFAMASW